MLETAQSGEMVTIRKEFLSITPRAINHDLLSLIELKDNNVIEWWWVSVRLIRVRVRVNYSEKKGKNIILCFKAYCHLIAFHTFDCVCLRFYINKNSDLEIKFDKFDI